jgi:hypothetical protein
LIIKQLFLDELLCNSAGTLDYTVTLRIGDSGANDTLGIDAIICPEGAIFGSNGSVDQQRGWRGLRILRVSASIAQWYGSALSLSNDAYL